MRVWDLPLRIFHWALMLSVIGAIGSSKAGVMWAHERFGLTVMGLIIFVSSGGLSGGITRDLSILSLDRALFLPGCARMAGRA